MILREKVGCKVIAFLVCSMVPLASVHAEIAAYPKKGQSQKQQAADKAACSSWATQQTGVDPEKLLEQQTQESAGTSGSSGGGAVRGAAKGAAAGALGGAIGGDTGKGAAIGAGVGAVGGAGKKARNQAEAGKEQDQAKAQLQEQLHAYEKAQKACLEGKGYSVS